MSRNSDAVGEFVYAVRTTGIYCRPDCKARLARQANVAFFDSGSLAEEAGYRACKRCKPNLLVSEEDPLLVKIRRAVDLVKETASQGQKISLHQLSSQVGLSKWHLQRCFRQMEGLSPHEMSNSILNAIEAEGSPQREFSEAEGTVPPVAGQTEPDPQIQSSQGAQELEAMHWGLTESENAEVDDVLKDVFPELYDEEFA